MEVPVLDYTAKLELIIKNLADISARLDFLNSVFVFIVFVFVLIALYKLLRIFF